MTGQDERETVAGILIEHTRMNIERCRCGWSDLGRSHARHVADALLAAGFRLTPTDDETTCRPHVFTPCECGDSDCREVVCVVCGDQDVTPTAEVKAEALAQIIEPLLAAHGTKARNAYYVECHCGCSEMGSYLGEKPTLHEHKAQVIARAIATHLLENGGA